MPIPENILNAIRCCLSDDGHIVIEPVVLKCGLNACKKCVDDSKLTTIQCFGCGENHEKKDYINAPISNSIMIFIKVYLGDLFEDLKVKLKSTSELLKGLHLKFLL